MIFISDRRGVIAIIFAIILPALVGFMGLGFDAVRGMLVQQRLQQAIDAASLAAASSFGDDEERKALASGVFAANYGTGLLAPPVTPDVTINGEGKVFISASATFDTYFMRLFKTNTLTIGARSGSHRATSDIEVVLVVDISGSMWRNAGNGMSRMQAVHAAANDLVDIMKENLQPGVRLRFAIVPYNVSVNVGTANGKFVTNTNHALFAGTSWKGCVQERLPPYHLSDEYDEFATDGSGKWHAHIWPPEPEPDQGPYSYSKFYYCENPSNGTNDGYLKPYEFPRGSNEAIGWGPNHNCSSQPITPLNEDLATVRDAINGLHYAFNAGTLIAPGVSWGMRVLSPGEPFTEAAPFSPLAKKIMIVMTDGMQINDGYYANCPLARNPYVNYSMDPRNFGVAGRTLTVGPRDIWTAYGYMAESRPFDGLVSSRGVSYSGLSFTGQADELLVDACTMAKTTAQAMNGEIEIYTLTFSSDASASSSVADAMRACASGSDHYQHAPNTSKLRQAFRSIGEIVADVRLGQ